MTASHLTHSVSESCNNSVPCTLSANLGRKYAVSFEGMPDPLRPKPSFDQHQCRLDLDDLRAGKTSEGGKNETVTSSVVLVGTHFHPLRMAGLVRRASDGNGKASAGKY